MKRYLFLYPSLVCFSLIIFVIFADFGIAIPEWGKISRELKSETGWNLKEWEKCAREILPVKSHPKYRIYKDGRIEEMSEADKFTKVLALTRDDISYADPVFSWGYRMEFPPLHEMPSEASRLLNKVAEYYFENNLEQLHPIDPRRNVRNVVSSLELVVPLGVWDSNSVIAFHPRSIPQEFESKDLDRYSLLDIYIYKISPDRRSWEVITSPVVINGLDNFSGERVDGKTVIYVSN